MTTGSQYDSQITPNASVRLTTILPTWSALHQLFKQGNVYTSGGRIPHILYRGGY